MKFVVENNFVTATLYYNVAKMDILEAVSCLNSFVEEVSKFEIPTPACESENLAKTSLYQRLKKFLLE